MGMTSTENMIKTDNCSFFVRLFKKGQTQPHQVALKDDDTSNSL